MPIAKAALEAFENKCWRQYHANVWMARQDEADVTLDLVKQELRRSRRLKVQPYKTQYEMARGLEVNARNAELAATRGQLTNLLSDAMEFPPGIDIANLRVGLKHQPSIPPELLDGNSPPSWADYQPRQVPATVMDLPGVRRLHDRFRDPSGRYRSAVDRWEANEKDRKARLRTKQDEVDALVAAEARRVDQENLELDEYRRVLAKGDQDTVAEYFDAALNSLLWPKGFPKRHQIEYQQSRTNLDVAFALPTIEIVPAVKSFKLDKDSNKAVQTLTPEAERQAVYHSVITQATLRIIRELFGSNAFNLVTTLSLTGKAEGYDDATGHPVEPHLVRFKVDIRDFDPITLERVTPEACLRALTTAL